MFMCNDLTADESYKLVIEALQFVTQWKYCKTSPTADEWPDDGPQIKEIKKKSFHFWNLYHRLQKLYSI